MNARQMTIGCNLRRAQRLPPAAVPRPDETEVEANASAPSDRENWGRIVLVVTPVDHHTGAEHPWLDAKIG